MAQPIGQMLVTLRPNGDPSRRTGPILVSAPNEHKSPAVVIEVDVPGDRGLHGARVEVEIDTWNGLPRVKRISTRDFS